MQHPWIGVETHTYLYIYIYIIYNIITPCQEREPLLPGAPKMDGGLEEWGLLLAL